MRDAWSWILVGALMCGCDASAPQPDGGPAVGMDAGPDAECAAGPENAPAACSDGCSNDGNAFIDCADWSCSNVGTCPCARRAESNRLLCSDGCDNDDDMLVDCADPDCAAACMDGGVGCGAEPETTAEACGDGCDNDGDTFVDCDDWGCSNIGGCPCALRAENSPAVCGDGCSNDGDPEVDCADPDCAAACGIDVPCSAEPENTPAACGDGCSNDGDVFIDCDDFDCSNIGSCPCASRMEIGAALCGDGCSNDGDALVDCADPDCATNPSCICVPDCAGRACGPNGCPAGDCGTCTAPAACDSSGSCVAACPSGTESSTTQCADGCDNDGDGRADCADSGCASIGSCPIGAVVVEDVTIAGLRAMRSDLVFGDLTVTGTLTIPARTETSVTITGANLDISRIDVEYLSCLGEDRDAPNVTLRASAQVRVGTVDLHGERGEDDGGMVCFDCWGGDGGNLTVDAPRIRVTGHIWLDGGGGATDQIDGGLRGPGCDGGDSGDLVLRSTTSLVCDGWGLSMDGGPGGGAEGSTWIGLDGDDGREGTLTLAGASIAIDEIEGGSGNASWIEAQPVPYAPLDILGHVDQTDDTDDRATGGIFVNITPAVRDFLEDLYELRVTTPGTLRVTLQFPSSDLDVYLLNSAHTMYLDSSNGVASPETFDFPVTAGTYYLGVSFSDDAAPVTATVPYTLQIR